MSTLKTTGKAAVITQLNNAINDRTVKSTAILTSKSQHLQDLFTELEGIPDIGASPSLAHRIIYEIVTQICVLISTTKLDLLLSDSKLDPSLKSHIPLALGKLGRYHYAASSLVRVARSKKYHLFRTVLVEPFSIDMPPALDKAIKVHAEIQLLFFYEAHANLPRPRIICASKSACYLCNLFFKFHGVFQVPRSHGKLYTQWILPDWLAIPPSRHAELGDITAQLNKALKTRLQKRTNGHPFPYESVISVPRDWTPSTTSKVTSVASTSTIRPQSPCHPSALSQLQRDPLTPPQTPLARIPSSTSPPLPLSAVESARTPRRTRHVSISSSQLPYSQLINAETPPLCLHLNNPPLSLEFDFSHASPCQLQLLRGEESEGGSRDFRTIYIEDIPTAAEMDITYSRHGPRELKFQLQGGDRGGVCVAVVWGAL
ncbi:hypothetical protein O988_05807 [Pseudogymnoascus sp. VKM F-3808]|nr:hypothetical protein O988_05807 [Pseudogymnoascus sp. VKM F-3808]